MSVKCYVPGILPRWLQSVVVVEDIQRCKALLEVEDQDKQVILEQLKNLTEKIPSREILDETKIGNTYSFLTYRSCLFASFHFLELSVQHMVLTFCATANLSGSTTELGLFVASIIHLIFNFRFCCSASTLIPSTLCNLLYFSKSASFLIDTLQSLFSFIISRCFFYSYRPIIL